jgi:hypothetical protein
MRRLIAILISLMLSSGFAQTQDPNTPPEQPGGGGANNPRFSIGGVIETLLGLNTNGSTVGAVGFTLKLGGVIGAEESPTGTFNANLGASIDAATGTTKLVLGETVVTAYLGNVDFSAGNLKFNWGSVDLFSIVNTINPVNFTTQERIPIPAVRVVWTASSDLKLEGVIAVGFTPSTLPAVPQTAPAAPPGITIVGQDAPIDNRPSAKLENTQYGLRITGNLQIFDGGDVSFSVYGGLRHTPTVLVRLNPTSQPGQFRVQPEFNYDFIHVIGLDTNLTLGGVAVRAEVGYTFTNDPNGTNPSVGNPSLEGTVQVEYTLEGMNLIGILNARWQKGEAGNADTFGVNAALSANYQLETRTTLGAVWVQSLSDGSGTILANVGYTLADGFKLEGITAFNYGVANSSFSPGGGFGLQLRFGLKFSF